MTEFNSFAASDAFEKFSFGITSEGLSHIFHVLRNQLYKEPVEAVIREYSCNAVDAHKLVGKGDVPIRVTLPDEPNYNFIVRDYGNGLTEGEIRDVFVKFGESTKRSSPEATGSLGFGCKSAFAYTDSFTINSFVNGNKMTYQAYIDPSGVGEVAQIGYVETEEPDGLEICIPTRSYDKSQFLRDAKKIYTFFDVKPNFVDELKFEKTNLSIVDLKPIYSGADWSLVKTADLYHVYGKSLAIINNVAYPIHAWRLDDNFEIDGIIERISPYFKFLFYFDKGEIDFAASREELQYTNKTKKNIFNKFSSLKTDFNSQFLVEFGNCSSNWERTLFVNNLQKKNLLGLVEDLSQTESYRHDLKFIHKRCQLKNGKLESKKGYIFQPEYNWCVGINDLTKGSPSHRVRKVLLKNNYDGMYLISENHYNDSVIRNYLAGIPEFRLSEWVKTKKHYVSNSSNKDSLIFYDITFNDNGVNSKKIKTNKDGLKSILSNGGYFLPISYGTFDKNFIGFSKYSARDMSNCIRDLNYLGYSVTKEKVKGINTAYLRKNSLGLQWSHLGNFIEDSAAEVFSNKENCNLLLIAKLIDHVTWRGLNNSVLTRLSAFRSDMKKKGVYDFFNLVEIFNDNIPKVRYLKSLYSVVKYYSNRYDNLINKLSTVDIDKYWFIFDKYPLLRYVELGYGFDFSNLNKNAKVEAIIDYLNNYEKKS